MGGSVVDAAVCCGLILLGTATGYYAGTRRRPPRHGSVHCGSRGTAATGEAARIRRGTPAE
jgi:hypothetical protein